MVRLLRSVLVLFFTALLVGVGPGASAHDELVDASPSDGAQLEAAPEEIRLTFSGQIATVGAQLAVTGGEGEALDGVPRVEGTEVVQDLRELAPGDYEVMWRVTSQDGHPISGTFSFAVQEMAGDVDEPAETAEQATGEGTTVEETTAVETSAAPAGSEDAPTGPEDPADTERADAEQATGIPAWVWVATGLAVLGLVALLIQTWSRGRGRR